MDFELVVQPLDIMGSRSFLGASATSAWLGHRPDGSGTDLHSHVIAVKVIMKFLEAGSMIEIQDGNAPWQLYSELP